MRQGLSVRPLDVSRSLPQGDLLDLRECALQSAELSSSPDCGLPRLDEGSGLALPLAPQGFCATPAGPSNQCGCLMIYMPGDIMHRSRSAQLAAVL